MLMAQSEIPSSEHLSNLDQWLAPYRQQLNDRLAHAIGWSERILNGRNLDEFALGHRHFGLHKTTTGWILREWAPAATKIFLHCEASKWADKDTLEFAKKDFGEWELVLPDEILRHGSHYKLHIYWNDGDGYRVPAWATYVVQDPDTGVFDAVVWKPRDKYEWQDNEFEAPSSPMLIYEAHVGMSSEKEAVSTYKEFTEKIIPRIKYDGYNTIQLMAIAEHPYYGSFGYHVSSFFAPSSRFGTPDEFKQLVDTAHQSGLRVLIDLVHSHAVKNEVEGLSRYDGSLTQFFHEGERGDHEQWDSRVFDYGKPQVAHFLLSNLRYWLDEYHVDGFRFDGITSMLYTHHGMGMAFDHYDKYFQDVDNDAVAYLTMANKLIHEIKPSAVTVAEDMSGMPGLAAAISDGGIGFDYRLSMGVPDLWIKYTQDMTDEDWKMSELFHELSQHRVEENTVSYAESHDQALVGDKTLIFRLADKEMYNHMAIGDENLVVDRALALHKLIRLLTASMNHGGYLNFMGNEFGHPEWIDFPRVENNWSYKYARRQWHLVDDKQLKYKLLGDFDKSMVSIIKLIGGAPDHIMTDDGDCVLAFERTGFVFVFNFHPVKSYEHYGVSVPQGDYTIVLSTDERKFGGFGRIDDYMTYPSDGQVKLYLPARTAVVLKRLV